MKRKKGLYVQTSKDHYRYFNTFCIETGAVQGSKTMYFKHKYITSPTVTPADTIVQATKELVYALCGKTAPPLIQSGIDELINLSNIFAESAEDQQKS